MDTSATLDLLNDTPTLPELSFDDLMDESPVKRNNSNIMDDPLDLDDGQKALGDDILNTPRPKKAPAAAITPATTTTAAVSVAHRVESEQKQLQTTPIRLAATTTTAITTHTNTKEQKFTYKLSGSTTAGAATLANTVKLATTVTTPTTTAATATPMLLNSKNILPKVAANFSNQFIKIAPKTITTAANMTPAATTAAAATPSTTTTTATTFNVGGKTAVKTANGQILYIQKTTGGQLAGVRLQASPATGIQTSHAAANTTSATATKSGGSSPAVTHAGGNKTVSIQVLRAADGGSIVPLKSTAAGGAAMGKNIVTLSPTTQVVDKKIVSTVSGHVYIKAPLKTLATAASSSPSATASSSTSTSTVSSPSSLPSETMYKNIKIQKLTPTSATSSAASSSTTTVTVPTKTTASAGGGVATSAANAVPVTSTGGRIIVQSANGKQIVVSNQNLVKLSPKSLTTNGSGTTMANAGTGAGQLHAIKITGKGGLQYVRVLPSTSKLVSANSSNAAGAAATHTVGAFGAVSVPAASTIATTTTTAAANVAAATKTTVANNSNHNTTAATATTTNTTATTTSTAAVTKLLNTMPQKFTVVRPSAGTKLVIKAAPKREGSLPVTYSPTTSKVKTMMTLPTLRPIDDTKPGSNISKINNVATSSLNLMRKHKISEINSELQRITADSTGPSEAKKTASGNRVVVMSRGPLPPGVASLQQHGHSALVQRVTVQGTTTATTAAASNNINSKAGEQHASQTVQASKKLYSVLKSNLCTHIDAEKKPLLTQQQQQHKSLLLKRPLQHTQQAIKLPQAPHSQLQQSIKLLQQSSQKRPQSTTFSGVYTSTLGSSVSNVSNVGNVSKFVPMKIKEEPRDTNDIKPMLEEAGGLVRRKHCNCSKSQCLKLYCDCFANGEFCQNCTCKDCFNNLEYEDERQRAIKLCLERNPSAFKPKITTSSDQGDMRLHNKGCNCKRSGCLKNYCECYEAKIPCSSNCKCVGCRNIEDRPDLDMDPIDPKLLASIANASAGSGNTLLAQRRSYDKLHLKGGSHTAGEKLLKDAAKALAANSDMLAGGAAGSLSGLGSASVASSGSNSATGAASAASEKPQCNFITQEVIDATIQCMISQADECEKNGLPAYQTEKMVMEELGRCLVEIIDFSIRNTDNSYTQE